MDVRKKLVELLAPTSLNFEEAVHLADYLVKNGVTVQGDKDINVPTKWISVTERLPEPETDVIAFVGDYIDILSYRYDRRGNLAFMYMDDNGWWHERIRLSVTHWCAMPQPPKGE